MPEFSTTNIEWVSGIVPSMDNIIKKLEVSGSDVKSEIIDHVIVEYDRRNGIAEVMEGKRFTIAGLLGLKRRAEYYRIDVYENTKISFEQKYKVFYPAYGEMELTAKFSVSALNGGEAILVQELARRDNLAGTLQDKIIAWACKAISDDLLMLFTNFTQFANGFSVYARQKGTAAGLRIDAQVNFKADAVPVQETIRIAVKEINVQPKMYNDFIRLDFDAVLVPDKQHPSHTLTVLGHQQKDSFKDLLVMWMQEYFRQSVSYNDIPLELHFKVRSGLMEFWNNRMNSGHKGWVVAELVLNTADTEVVNFKFERLEIDVALKNTKIPLINTVILNLENPELFKNRRIDNLELWIKEKLQATAQYILATVSYAELISDIDGLVDKIRQELNKHASQIGYRIEYLLTSDLIDHSKLNFEFQFSEEEQVYQTSLNEKVKLNIIVNGRILSLNNSTWKNTLTPQTDFVQEMKKGVLKLVRVELIRVNPDEFYTRFTDLVAPKLEAAIRNLLVANFNVDAAVDIVAQMELSVLRQLIIDLQRGQHSVKITCFDGKAEFNVDFSVAAIDKEKWALFANRNQLTAAEVIASISKRVQRFVENEVNTKGDINIIYDPGFFEIIRHYAEQSNLVIRDTMGLIIEIIDVEVVVNSMVSKMVQFSLESAESKLDRLMKEIKKLDNDILGAIINDDDDWEIDNLTKKKKKLQGLLEQENFSDNKLTRNADKDLFNSMLNNTSTTKQVKKDNNNDEDASDAVQV
jgi:hypothetical protein